ncbi:MAG: GGDEF domain-containing protein [Pseudomonadota bacterium]
MVTPLKSANTIDFNRARQEVVANRPETTAELANEPLRYRLLSRLQSTLQLENIIRLFHTTLREMIALEGIRYLHEARSLQVKEGDNASHSCGYRLHTRQGDLGEIILYRSLRFSDRELSGIESLLTTLVHPLHNALQYRDALDASITDPLTGAGNRAGLDQALEREIALASRHSQPLSMLMIDIDNFRRINDQFGHGAGDTVLRETVQRFHAEHRNTDLCFRYGGEEFVILLNRTDQPGALTIADRIRSRVADAPFQLRESPLRITVSIGVSQFAGTDTMDSLLDRADRALYNSKRDGGNQAASL